VDSNEPSSLNFFLQKPELSGSLRNIRDLSPLSSLRFSDPSESTVTHHRFQQTFLFISSGRGNFSVLT